MNRYFGVHVLDGEWHALLPRYLVLAERVEGKRVLDIGCGTGIGSSLLLELGASHVDGVDYQPGVLDLAKIKHAKENLDFHTMLWEDLDFPDDSFDVVVCLDPMTPVTDPNLLEEVSRVLTDDGEYVCAIERRTIEGFESLLPKYGYTSPAENVEVGGRDEQAPQIGELTNYFDNLTRVLQRPEYNYVFEPEQADGAGNNEANPVDFTLCTEDSHIAGVELIFCGSNQMPEPTDRTIRLPYYRLAERLQTVIRDLNMRQGPGSSEEAPLDGPVEPGLDDQTSPESTQPEADTRDWSDNTPTNVTERPDEVDDSDEFQSELERLTGAYRQLQQNFEQLREQTQAAMVAQERSIDQLVELLRSWRPEGEEPDEGADLSGARAEDLYETSDFEAEEADESSDSDEATDELRRKLEEQQAYIDELEEKLDEEEPGELADDSSSELADDSSGELADDSSAELGDDESDPEETSGD